MAYVPENPLIVQGDSSVLLEVHSPLFREARDHLARFAELIKSPEHIHTYRLTPLSVWNAIAAGFSLDEILDSLTRYAKYDVPPNVLTDIREYAGRYGRLKLTRDEEPGRLRLEVADAPLAAQLERRKELVGMLGTRLGPLVFAIDPMVRGRLKQELIKIGWPAEDLAGYVRGEALAFRMLETTRAGLAFALRDYQHEAVDIFHAAGSVRGGSGVIVMPCGAGKTLIGVGVMEQVQASTLVICTSVTAVRQWIGEILDKTTLTPDQVGEYSGESKMVRPVTVTTYQMLTHRTRKAKGFVHFDLFNGRDWGLIIYDEVHVLPAPIFSITAEIQARRRLGLTATLVREDGHEEDVFALIGPKKADVPWKDLEAQGWIAKALCYEVRLPLPAGLRMDYAVSDRRQQFRLASENPAKLPLIRALLAKHQGESVLIIGQYLDQLDILAHELNVPVITGETTQPKRDELYGAFRRGELPVLLVSKVANFAIDLPDARVAIQVSGTFGSRQEEAQRLGRVLRPKSDGGPASFYTLVTRESAEQDFAQHRQLFLTEQGYAYSVLDAAEVLREAGGAA